MGGYTSSLEEVEQNIAWLEEYFEASLGVELGGDLARSFRCVDDIRSNLSGHHTHSPEEQRAMAGDLATLNRLAKLVYLNEPRVSAFLREHVKVWRSGRGMGLHELGPPTHSRNLSWEVYVAGLLADRLDVRPGEPDILFRFLGAEWGAACKVISTPVRASAVRRIAEGARQIEDSRAKHGVVIANVTALVPHERFFPLPTDEPSAQPRWRDRRHSVTVLDEWLRSYISGLLQGDLATRTTSYGPQGTPREKVRGVCLVAEATTFVGDALVLLTAGEWVDLRPDDRGEQRIKRLVRQTDEKIERLAIRFAQMRGP